MPNGRIYLDYNATAPLLPCARDAMVNALESFGNGSSVHHEGRAARKRIEDARSSLADWIGVGADHITFSSGATESANHVLSPTLIADGQPLNVSKLYVSSIEHPCVLAGGRFTKEQIDHIGVLESGRIHLEALEQKLAAHNFEDGLAMVVVMAANNETGIVQPLSDIGNVCQQHGAIFVVDAVQALGKIDFDLDAWKAHFAFVSSHKIGGPQGVGATIVQSKNLMPVPLLRGGGQEAYRRAGTENLAAIAGFGAACGWHQKETGLNTRLAELQQILESGLKTISLEAGNSVPQPVIFGETVERLPNTTAFAIPGIEAETALINLDLEGFSVSSGSACSSGRISRSHVLTAMDVSSDLTNCALRISSGWATEPEHTQKFLSAWQKIIQTQL